MFWADTIGSKTILEQITQWHQRYGERWKPSSLLLDIGAKDGSFREAKGAGFNV